MSIPTPAPVTPPGDQGVPAVTILPGGSALVIEGDFSTYNERPKAVAAEITITTTTASTITLDNAPYVLRCDCTSNNVAVTLPPANSCIGRIVCGLQRLTQVRMKLVSQYRQVIRYGDLLTSLY
jgi:hypothetical protein